MKTEMKKINKDVQKKQWMKPAVVELDVAMTRTGSSYETAEDPIYGYYGPTTS